MDTTTTEQAVESEQGLTFEKVWEALMELRASIKEDREREREAYERAREAYERDREAYEREKKERQEADEREKKERQEAYEREKKEKQEADERAREAYEREKKEKQEADEREKKERQEADELYEKKKQEADERFREEMEKSRREHDRMIEELQKNVGGVQNTIGKLTEAMFMAGLMAEFNNLGYEFTRTHHRTKYKVGKTFIGEVDACLENGEYVMLVEIKTEMKKAYVDDYLEQVGRIRKYMDAKGDDRKIIGGVAGGIVSESVQVYAQKKGLYVAVQSGDSVCVADAPKGFKPRVW
jgi:DNA repair exonuclease SbcCD ATPase subunit